MRTDRITTAAVAAVLLFGATACENQDDDAGSEEMEEMDDSDDMSEDGVEDDMSDDMDDGMDGDMEGDGG